MNDEVQRYALYQEREDSEHCATSFTFNSGGLGPDTAACPVAMSTAASVMKVRAKTINDATSFFICSAPCEVCHPALLQHTRRSPMQHTGGLHTTLDKRKKSADHRESDQPRITSSYHSSTLCLDK